ncbi:GGDEF domain-containing protein [Actinoplanes ianthinogenes]|uniref:GGDEF domain-containing protein n=1 Tax=Actinoplanes ianthinogenes TaxID=122358 RepID=UPI002467ED35|nr:GGDEF domain-containing protein [Actinoplanes ianthinogenes]
MCSWRSTTAWGTGAGDDLLGLVAGRIRGCLRPSDTAARIGGDEFAVLLGDCRAGQAVPVAQRLIDAIKQPFAVGGQEVFIGAPARPAGPSATSGPGTRRCPTSSGCRSTS